MQATLGQRAFTKAPVASRPSRAKAVTVRAAAAAADVPVSRIDV
jgi:hypothetical protein